MAQNRPKYRLDPEQIKKVIRDDQLPNLVAVAAEFHNLVGGPGGLSRMLLEVYENAPAGGMVRARILDMVCSHLKFLTPKDENREKHKYLNDDDLQSEIDKIVKEKIAPLLNNE